MQRKLPFMGLLLLVACSPQDTSETTIISESPRIAEVINIPAVDLKITDVKRSKQNLLAYFDSLIKNKQIIVGQHCGDGPDQTADYYKKFVDVLADETGRHVGLIGADFGFFPSEKYPVQTLINHWNEGGLVTVNWTVDNPFLAGYDAYWNTLENAAHINLKALLKDAPHSEVRTNYRNELDNMAGALQQLRDAGVTVIWRPFHEMNGDFFWWGINAYHNQQNNESDFVSLWQDLYHTLTWDYGLDNLIWTYSVMPDQGWNAGVKSFYPGSDYVDLVGMDYYGTEPTFPDYDVLKSLGKTIVMSETGPSGVNYGKWNQMDLANALKGKAAYYLQRHSLNEAAVAIKDNENTIEMMNSDTVITLGELNWIPEF